eukprot:g48357.t1
MLKDVFIELDMMLKSSIASSNMPQRKTIMTSSEDQQDTSDRVLFVVCYFLGVEKLCHVLRSLQHIIDDDEHLAKLFPVPPLLTFKQPPSLEQTIVRSNLPSNQDNSSHN